MQYSQKEILNKVIEKVISGRYFLCLAFGITACIGFLNGILSPDAFLGLAGGVFTGYQMKGRTKNDN